MAGNLENISNKTSLTSFQLVAAAQTRSIAVVADIHGVALNENEENWYRCIYPVAILIEMSPKMMTSLPMFSQHSATAANPSKTWGASRSDKCLPRWCDTSDYHTWMSSPPQLAHVIRNLAILVHVYTQISKNKKMQIANPCVFLNEIQFILI